MTQEQKARAYDEAKERMRAFLKEWENCGAYGEAMEKARSVFPELAESEDERIRKHIIEILNSLPGCYWHGEKDKSDCVTYLEKQKERGPLTKEEEYTLHRIIEYLEDEICPSEWVNLLHDIYCLPYQKQKEPHYTKRNALFDKCVENCDPEVMKEASDEIDEMLEKEQEPIKVEVYEVGKGITICGQDYRCKKDYKEGNCWYIKNAIYHCGRDGYLTDQNGVSWSCTPEWFNEYIYTNDEWADKEKNDFVSGQFLQCKLSFDDFKEGEHYWLEYVGDDMYVGRSDNILNQKFHITPRQLYTLFSQQLEEVQGPPQEEKQASLTYEPPFNENPSDKEIIEALIHHLNEQDGFLTAINCVSTKAILSWLIKQKEQKPSHKFNVGDTIHCKYDDREFTIKSVDLANEVYKYTKEGCGNDIDYADENFELVEQKPAEWSDTKELVFQDICKHLQEEGYSGWVLLLNALRNGEFQPKQEWSEEDEDFINMLILHFNYLIDKGGDSVETYKSYREKLKSLRPQPKKELSIEKAIQWLDDTFCFLDNSSGRGRDCEITTHDFDSLEEMYDSFRKAVTVDSEPHWKPSEEQMEALEDAFRKDGSDEYRKTINSLYQDLKKL